MPRYLITILLTTILAGGAWPQESETGSEADTEEAAEAAADEAADDSREDTDETEVDDSDLDLQTYEEDEDDFVPTEEIPADQAIPFPTDI